MSGERFRRRERIRRRREFLAVYRQGTRVHRPGFIIYALPNQLGYNRLGLSVSRKVGGAVIRNRVRRRLREVFRRNKRVLDNGVDLVVNARPQLAALAYQEIERDYLAGLQQLRRRLGDPEQLRER